MPNVLSVIVPVGPALAWAAIVIGVTVRVAVMVQPGTRFQSYWRSFFLRRLTRKKTRTERDRGFFGKTSLAAPSLLN